MKTSPAICRRLFFLKKKTRTYCLSRPQCLSLFYLCLSWFSSMCCFLFVFGNSSWISFCAPTSMVLDIVEGQGRGGAQKWPKFTMGKNIEKIRRSKNVQNSIWGKTGHLQICRLKVSAPPDKRIDTTAWYGLTLLLTTFRDVHRAPIPGCGSFFRKGSSKAPTCRASTLAAFCFALGRRLRGPYFPENASPS